MDTPLAGLIGIWKIQKKEKKHKRRRRGEMGLGVVSLSATAAAAAIQQQLGVVVFPATRSGGSGGGGEAFSISTRRTHICFPQQRHRRGPLFFRVKSVQSSSRDLVPSNVFTTTTTEKEQVKAVLTMFLKNEIGLSNEATARTISNLVPFIDHLVARLHSIHKTQYLSRKVLTTLEIRDALVPYLKYLCKDRGDSLDDVMEIFSNTPDKEREDHRDSLDDVVENFPNPPEEEKKRHISEASPTKLPLIDSKKLKAMARMTEIGTDGQLHPNTLYLVDIGLDMNQIKQMARRYPSITCPGWGRYARSLVEFLLDLGMPPSDIPKVLYKTPGLCNLSLSENIIPSMAYLETLGLDKSKWAKVIKQSPHLLIYSRQKVKATVDYFYELGLSRERIGRVLTRFPDIVKCNVDDNLHPTAEYFRSMGVNPTSLLSRYPEVFGLSIECKLKPVTEFLLDKGFSTHEIGTMTSWFGTIYSLSLTKNLIPKWDFFLTMDYPRPELVKYPIYFGFSLEKRIKPRYALMRECDVKLSIMQLLSPSDSDLHRILNRMKKKKTMLDVQL